MAHSKASLEQRSDRDSWALAWVLTLALHAGAFLVVGRLAPPKPPSMIHRAEPVRLVFKRSSSEAARVQDHTPEQPLFFSELPPDRADATPKKAELLSNVTSRARDLVREGDRAMPRMEGDIDVPLIKLEPDGRPPRPPVRPSPDVHPTESATPPAVESPHPESPTASQQAVRTGTGSTSPGPIGLHSTPPMSTPVPEGAMGATGGSDIYQPEMANPDGNAPLTGDVSLNTTAWNYAPWLQRFGRRLMRRWIPPPAYSFGILKEGGWAMIEVEISRSGQLLRLEVHEEHGHPSLSQAAQTALRSMAPIEPLPADFPEPTLILRIRMIYPRIRPRW